MRARESEMEREREKRFPLRCHVPENIEKEIKRELTSEIGKKMKGVVE